jgi:hypothetical protein
MLSSSSEGDGIQQNFLALTAAFGNPNHWTFESPPACHHQVSDVI